MRCVVQSLLTWLLPFQSSLPSAVGSAYVGETFSCTLCARNEAPQVDGASGGGVVVVVVSDVSIVAEMQTPSVTVALELDPPPAEADAETDTTREPALAPGQTVQKIASLNLAEPGNYTLVVTVTYTERSSRGLESAAATATERVRTFRKLYQFLAQQSLAVRTKTVELELPAEGGSVAAKTQATKYLLEAQLENVTQDRLTLEVLFYPPHKFSPSLCFLPIQLLPLTSTLPIRPSIS